MVSLPKAIKQAKAVIPPTAKEPKSPEHGLTKSFPFAELLC
jgi:hypothetical protein